MPILLQQDPYYQTKSLDILLDAKQMLDLLNGKAVTFRVNDLAITLREEKLT